MALGIEILKRWRKEINWQIEKERGEFFRLLYISIQNWEGQLPNLRDILRKEEIEDILTRAVALERREVTRFVVDTGYKNIPDVDKDGCPLLRHTTPVHYAARWRRYNLLHDLFEIYDRFDVNYVDQQGITHSEVACQNGFSYVIERFLKLEQQPNYFTQKSIDSLLRESLKSSNGGTVELLLGKGADPNSVNADGSTPLHILSKQANFQVLEIFFKTIDDMQQTVQVNVHDKQGNTPLHLALQADHKKITEYLLRRGANPNLANAEGSTPLHNICNNRVPRYDMLKYFLKINDEIRWTVHVNARDDKGNTPLHLVLQADRKEITEYLLGRGANQNLANARGFTALQCAVANLSLKTVDVLLKHGTADLSSFVFPTEDHFYEVLDPDSISNFKSNLASSAMELVELLENGGYELDRREALTIMALFAKYGLFQKSADLEKRWYDDENFAKQAKKIKINSSQSLYDLIQLPPQEAAKKFARSDLLKFGHSKKLLKLRKSQREACTAHLCETLSRRFFFRWAGNSLWQLLHYRMPILCCDMINEVLMNEDLRNICLAAERQSSS